MNDLATALKENNIKLTYTDNVLALIAKKSFSTKYGARNMHRYIQTEIEDTIASGIISARGKRITNVYVGTSADGESISVICSGGKV